MKSFEAISTEQIKEFVFEVIKDKKIKEPKEWEKYFYEFFESRAHLTNRICENAEVFVDEHKTMPVEVIRFFNQVKRLVGLKIKYPGFREKSSEEYALDAMRKNNDAKENFLSKQLRNQPIDLGDQTILTAWHSEFQLKVGQECIQVNYYVATLLFLLKLNAGKVCTEGDFLELIHQKEKGESGVIGMFETVSQARKVLGKNKDKIMTHHGKGYSWSPLSTDSD